MMVANWCLKHLFKTITLEDFLQVKAITNAPAGKPNGVIYLNGEKLPEERVINLVQEARAMQKMDLYKKLLASMRTNATDQMVNKSKTVDDMVFGKAMLYSIDVLEKKIGSIAKL